MNHIYHQPPENNRSNVVRGAFFIYEENFPWITRNVTEYRDYGTYSSRYRYIIVLEWTQKFRTSNTRTLACPNFEHLELIWENSSRTRTSKVELRTSIKINKFCFWGNLKESFKNMFFSCQFKDNFAMIFILFSKVSQDFWDPNWGGKYFNMISNDLCPKMSLKRAK